MVTRLAKLGALKPEEQQLLEKVKPGEVAKKIEPSHKEKGRPFRSQWLPSIASESLPTGWQRRADPDTVRLLQESAYAYYVRQVPEDEATDSAGLVYEKAALWVAREYPIASVRSHGP